MRQECLNLNTKPSFRCRAKHAIRFNQYRFKRRRRLCQLRAKYKRLVTTVYHELI